MTNYSKLSFAAKSENVAVARLWVAAFCAKMAFGVEEIEEIKVAVSEGVSNAIIHGYHNDERAMVEMELSIEEQMVTILIRDNGCGIKDLKKAMEPMVSSSPDRMGLGFVFMQSFMDEFHVESSAKIGTTLTMKRSALS